MRAHAIPKTWVGVRSNSCNGATNWLNSIACDPLKLYVGLGVVSNESGQDYFSFTYLSS